MTTVTTSAATTSQQIITPTPTPAPTAIGADFNMFLKLLTTQMQNQDPLNPTDSTQYTQQLATYSQVEQTVQQSATLKDILSNLTGNLSAAAGFIGKDAVFSSAVSGLGSQPASWTYSAGTALTAATATITDSTGKTVATRVIGSAGTSGTFNWDGTLADGTSAPAGAYTLAIHGKNAAGATVAAAINSTGIVSDVSTKNGVVSLGVNGVAMSMDTLVRLAAAG